MADLPDNIDYGTCLNCGDTDVKITDGLCDRCIDLLTIPDEFKGGCCDGS